jgi:phage-related minor tail protein
MFICNEILVCINNFIDGIVNKINGLISSISNVGNAVGSKVSGAYNSVSGFVSGKRAAGGYVASGHSYLVGEQGPEIFTPNGGGYITPNGALGMRPVAVYITGNNISSSMDLNLIADQVGRAIVNKLRLNQKMNI